LQIRRRASVIKRVTTCISFVFKCIYNINSGGVLKFPTPYRSASEAYYGTNYKASYDSVFETQQNRIYMYIQLCTLPSVLRQQKSQGWRFSYKSRTCSVFRVKRGPHGQRPPLKTVLFK